MKHFFIGAVVAAFFVGCTQQRGVTLALTGLDAEDSVKIMYENLADNARKIPSDTFAIPRGRLFIPTAECEPAIYSIYKLPRHFPDGTMEAMSMHGIYLPVLPGAAINVEGDFKNYTISGDTPFYKELAAIEAQIKPLRGEAFAATVAAYDKQCPEARRDSLAAVAAACEENISQIVKSFIADNADSDVALYAFYHYADIEKDYDALQALSERVRRGIFASYYNNIVERYDKIQKHKEALKLVADGMTAPDFTLRSIGGEDVTLSSLRGKYVVLDFWGTWCGWCIKGIPEMKKMYQKYSNRLEVVGIACGDTEEAWKKSVAANELPWTNLINGTEENNLPEKYAIKGYPTKIILDGEGRIIKTILGESPAFYNCIDSLMAL